MRITQMLIYCFCIIGFCSCATSVTSDTTSTTSSATKAVISKNTINTDFSQEIDLSKTNNKTIFINSTNKSICNIDLTNALKENLLSKGYFLIEKDKANSILDFTAIKCEDISGGKKLVASMFVSQKDSGVISKEIFITTSILDSNMYLVEAVPLLEEEMAYQIGKIF